jgi:hypothetical protein
MDINLLVTKDVHNEGAEMQVIGPDGKKTDFYIRLVGPDSDKLREIKAAAQRAAIAKLTEGKDSSINTASFIAEATLGWRGLTHADQEIEFSREVAENLYINAPYICEQADKFIAKRVNFIKA